MDFNCFINVTLVMIRDGPIKWAFSLDNHYVLLANYCACSLGFTICLTVICNSG